MHLLLLWLLCCFLLLKDCVVSSAAEPEHTLISTNPSCGLWLYSAGLLSDTGQSGRGLTISTGPSRALHATVISLDSDFSLAHSGTYLLLNESIIDAHLLGVSSVYILWPQSESKLYVDAAHVLGREPLLLVQDFDLTIGNSTRRHWMTIRRGDDFDTVTNRFLYSIAPTASEDEFYRLRSIILNVQKSKMEHAGQMKEALVSAVKESYELQASVNLVVGDVVEKISTIQGSGFWVHHTVNSLDLTHDLAFSEKTGGILVDRIVAEHVWEHLTLAEAIIAAKNCLEALAPGGRLRIAVPDPAYALALASRGEYPSHELGSPAERVYMLSRVGIISHDIKDGHLIQWSACSLSEVLRIAGFRDTHIEAIEYTDQSTHSTVSRDWKVSDGPINRSSKGERRAPISIIVDARKPYYFENRTTEGKYFVVFDCTVNSLANSQPDLWHQLVALLPVHLRRLFGSDFEMLVLLSSHTIANNTEIESDIEEEIAAASTSNPRAKISVLHLPKGSPHINCTELPNVVMEAIANQANVHIITGKDVYSSCPCKAWRTAGHAPNIVTIHSGWRADENLTATRCVAPFVTSTMHNVTECTNTRFGLLASEFGHDIAEDSILEFRQRLINDACKEKTENFKSKIRNNPYVVVMISDTQCTALKYYEEIKSIQGNYDQANFSNARYEVGLSFWSVISGIAEGSQGMIAGSRPWVLFVGRQCRFDSSPRLTSVDWVHIEDISSTSFRRMMAGALGAIHLPDITSGGEDVLHFAQLPVLRSLGLGCPVVMWNPANTASDFIGRLKEHEMLAYPNINPNEYWSSWIIVVEEFRPLPVWHAVRRLIAKSKYGREISPSVSEKNRIENIWRIRKVVMGWNRLSAAVLERMGLPADVSIASDPFPSRLRSAL